MSSSPDTSGSVPEPDELPDRLLWELGLQRIQSTGARIWSPSDDEWDAAVLVEDGIMLFGLLRYRWEHPAGPPVPECEVAGGITLAQIPDDRAAALAFVGPFVEQQRARYRRRFFRCANCRQRLPRSARSEAAPDAQLCHACADARGYVPVVH